MAYTSGMCSEFSNCVFILGSFCWESWNQPASRPCGSYSSGATRGREKKKEGEAEVVATLWMSGKGLDSGCPGGQEGQARREIHFCVYCLYLSLISKVLPCETWAFLLLWVNCLFQADTGKADDVVCVAAPSCIQRLWIGQNLGESE